jgi:hypothetical protein
MDIDRFSKAPCDYCEKGKVCISCQKIIKYCAIHDAIYEAFNETLTDEYFFKKLMSTLKEGLKEGIVNAIPEEFLLALTEKDE